MREEGWIQVGGETRDEVLISHAADIYDGSASLDDAFGEGSAVMFYNESQQRYSHATDWRALCVEEGFMPFVDFFAIPPGLEEDQSHLARGIRDKMRILRMHEMDMWWDGVTTGRERLFEAPRAGVDPGGAMLIIHAVNNEVRGLLGVGMEVVTPLLGFIDLVGYVAEPGCEGSVALIRKS